jgi:hypothetical protein
MENLGPPKHTKMMIRHVKELIETLNEINIDGNYDTKKRYKEHTYNSSSVKIFQT